MEERQYQRALTELGIKENIIVCLPTGSGKTLIAVNVMNSSEFKEQVYVNGKKIIFLVHTVELAQQQGDVIRRLTNFEVLICTSNSVSGWLPSRWKAELDRHHVFVMIAQLCYDKLLANLLKFKNIAILVVDECHNATKRHKMSEVMSLYHQYVIENNCNCEKPRIIGLTATINKTKMKEVTLEKMNEEVASLEEKMAARAVTFDDVKEIERFSTSSTIIPMKYSPELKPEWGDMLVGIRQVQEFLDQQRSRQDLPEIAKEVMRSSNGVNFSVGSVYWSNSPDLKTELNRLILDFMDLHNELGPLGLLLTLEHKISKLDNIMMNKVNDKRSRNALNVNAVRTQFQQYFALGGRTLSSFKNSNASFPSFKWVKWVSYKVEALLDILSQYRVAEGTSDALVGLVFVKRRSCATAVKTLIELFAEAEPEKYRFLKPEMITGTNNVKKDVSQARVSAAQQKRTIEKFRNGQINLIICTTVLEEGIDVPSCNLVVRFDEVNAYTSFIQSMGRARKKGARFVALTAGQGNFSQFMAQHQTMTEVLTNRRYEDEITNGMSRSTLRETSAEETDYIPDFAPLGPMGPKITAASATALVYQYIQRDKSRQIICWWANVPPPPEDKTKEFQGYVFIRGSSLFPNTITGPLASSSDGAKRAVFMKVAQMLWDRGVLNENLVVV